MRLVSYPVDVSSVDQYFVHRLIDQSLLGWLAGQSVNQLIFCNLARQFVLQACACACIYISGHIFSNYGNGKLILINKLLLKKQLFCIIFIKQGISALESTSVCIEEIMGIYFHSRKNVPNTSVLHVFFRDITCMKYARDAYMTWDAMFGKQSLYLIFQI